MKKKLCLTMLMALGIFGFLIIASTGNVTASYKVELDSPYTTSAPTIDGIFSSSNEWSDSVVTSWFYEPESEHPDDYIYIHVMNDASNLYMLFDICPDNTEEYDDYLGIAFDENNNGLFTSGTSGEELEKAEFWLMSIREMENPLSPPLPTQHYQIAWGFEDSPNQPDWEHTIVEIAIPFTSFTYEGQIGLGDTMGFHAEGYGTLAPEWVFPETSNDISTILALGDEIAPETEAWGTITLGEPTEQPPPQPEPTPVVDQSKEIGMGIMAIAGIFLLGSVIFREELGSYYAPMIIISLVVLIVGAMNYNFGYVKTLPTFW